MREPTLKVLVEQPLSPDDVPDIAKSSDRASFKKYLLVPFLAFIHLPAEVQVMIVKTIFKRNDICKIEHFTLGGEVGNHADHLRVNASAQLLLVSKFFHIIGKSVLYGENTFTFNQPSTLKTIRLKYNDFLSRIQHFHVDEWYLNKTRLSELARFTQLKTLVVTNKNNPALSRSKMIATDIVPVILRKLKGVHADMIFRKAKVTFIQSLIPTTQQTDLPTPPEPIPIDFVFTVLQDGDQGFMLYCQTEEHIAHISPRGVVWEQRK